MYMRRNVSNAWRVSLAPVVPVSLYPGKRVHFTDKVPLSYLRHTTQLIDCLLAKVVTIELFHEQLPLPVPCYALALVIEFTLDPCKMGRRVPSTSLTWRAVSTRLENVFTAAC